METIAKALTRWQKSIVIAAIALLALVCSTTMSAPPVPVIGAGVPVAMKEFKSSGVFTFTVPNKVVLVNVEVWGAGGGAGFASSCTTGGYSGAGAYSRATMFVSPNDTITVTIGQEAAPGTPDPSTQIGRSSASYWDSSQDAFVPYTWLPETGTIPPLGGYGVSADFSPPADLGDTCSSTGELIEYHSLKSPVCWSVWITLPASL